MNRGLTREIVDHKAMAPRAFKFRRKCCLIGLAQVTLDDVAQDSKASGFDVGGLLFKCQRLWLHNAANVSRDLRANLR